MERNQLLISLKTVASIVPSVLALGNGNTITNPYDITNTFNNYFASIAETAKLLKQFLVVKKDFKQDYNSYRPISLLSNIEIILETITYKTVYTFFNNKNIIYNLPFGFRQQYCTSLALIDITDRIKKALDDGNIDCGVFLDLQKAFDTVDHWILLAKLNHYGIHAVSNDWFKSYLSNRKQSVPINEYESGLNAINCPQGSILDPRYFYYV